jgi:cysteine-rich secretory family protein
MPFNFDFMNAMQIFRLVLAIIFFESPIFLSRSFAAPHDLGEASRMPGKLSILAQEPKPKIQTYTGGFVVNTDSREEVRDFYNAIYPTSENVPINSTADVSDCYPGTNSPLFVESVLRRINWFRAMAGEPANVVFDSTYNSNAQAVAVMISSSGLLNHNPPTNWPCYSPAGGAAAGGNQAGGFNGADAITGYVWDFGDGNSEVGHRRWILYPQEQIMGTGDVPATNSYIAANSTYVFDSSINDPRPATRQSYVAWPPEGFVPYQVVYPYWSFALSNADFSAATVNMTSNGVPVSVAIQTYQTGYGENTIVWIPMGLDANCECTTFPFSGTDTVYSITVSNIVVGSSNVSFAYNVTVFDPAVPGADYVPTTVTGATQAVANAGNNYNCTPLNNTNTTGYLWLTAQRISGNVIEDADSDLANTGLVNFTYSPAPADYSILTNAPDGTSDACFHLCHLDPTSQFLTLNELLFPATNTTVSFESLLAYASPDETARVQVSADGGVTWQDVFVEAGLPDDQQPVESAFSQHSLSLSNYAGQSLLLRFNYAFTGGEYWPYSDPDTGWDLENIVVTNAEQLLNLVTNCTISTNFTFMPTQTGNYNLAAAPIIFSQFPLNFGPVKEVTVISNSTPVILMGQPTVTNDIVQLPFTVSGVASTFHLLQVSQLGAAWTTNGTATLTTNVLGSLYRFTTTNGSAMQFYRVQMP